MDHQRQTLAVIPARAGSKGMPGKNTMMLLGRPILAYTLDDLADSRQITHIVAITNDRVFADQARALGVEVLPEPEELAGDDVPIGRPIEFAVNTVERNRQFRFDAVVQCEVTTPVRPENIFDRCLDLLWSSHAEVVMTIELADIHPPEWVVARSNDGRIRFPTAVPPLHRQDMTRHYHVGGACAIFRRDVVGVSNYLQCDCAAVEYKHHECIYLDEPLDAELAEFFLARRQAASSSP